MIFIQTFIGPMFYKLLYMSLTALAAGTAVLLIRRLADKRFSPFWKYAMWVLVLAALVIPWRPQSKAAVLGRAEAVQDVSFREDLRQAEAAYSVILSEAQAPAQEIEAARSEAAALRAKTLAFDELLPLLWLCGAAGVAVFMGIGAIRLRRGIQRAKIPGDMTRYENLLERCKRRLGVKRRVRIVLQSHVGTPALLGLLRPVILLPDYAANMSDERLEYVILHELSHLKRGDGFVNTLLLALRAVYWFNPLVWLLFRYIREDMELANDAAVLRGMEQESRKEYSLSLVEVLASCGKQRHAMLCMADSKKNIERRIGMIQLGEFFKKRKWVIAVAGLLVIAGVAALFLTAGIKQEQPKGESKRFQYKDLILEITNVASEEIRTTLDHGTDPYDYTVYTLYPGAWLSVINADMYDGSVTETGLPHGKYYVYDSSKGRGEEIDEYIWITDDMPPLELTPNMTHVGSEMLTVLRFEMYDETKLAPPLRPAFLPLDEGLAALKPLIYGSQGWGIDTQGDYIFAQFWKYVLRYDVRTNQIDRIIDLGEAPEYWYYNTTFSPDGQGCMAQAHEFDGPGQTGRVFIDLKIEAYMHTEQEHFPYDADRFYQIEDVEKIKALVPHEYGTAMVIAMDKNRAGAILPSNEAGWDALGYYRFAVIDLAQDKIVQECPMNVLGPGEVLSLYPTEAEPQPSKFTALISGLMEDGSPCSFVTADPVGFERLNVWDKNDLPQLDFTPAFGQTVEVELVPGSLKDGVEYDAKVVQAAVKRVTPVAPAVTAQYVRTNGGYPYDEREKTVVIESKKQLDDYYRANRAEEGEGYGQGKFNFDYPHDASKSFADAATKYNDAYFKDNLLVLAVLVEGSGSNRHIVTGVDFAPNYASWNNGINIKRITGGVSTADMAAWHIMVEISRADCSNHAFALNMV